MNDPKTPRTEDECEFWLWALFAGRTCGFALKLATKNASKKAQCMKSPVAGGRRPWARRCRDAGGTRGWVELDPLGRSVDSQWASWATALKFHIDTDNLRYSKGVSFSKKTFFCLLPECKFHCFLVGFWFSNWKPEELLHYLGSSKPLYSFSMLIMYRNGIYHPVN